MPIAQKVGKSHRGPNSGHPPWNPWSCRCHSMSALLYHWRARESGRKIHSILSAVQGYRATRQNVSAYCLLIVILCRTSLMIASEVAVMSRAAATLLAWTPLVLTSQLSTSWFIYSSFCSLVRCHTPLSSIIVRSSESLAFCPTGRSAQIIQWEWWSSACIRYLPLLTRSACTCKIALWRVGLRDFL